MTVFGTLKLPNLISRKIWMAEKFFAFHTVTSAERGSLGMLLPLWFYVKSILRDPKTAILALFEALNIDSFENSTFLKDFWILSCETSQNDGSLWDPKITKFDFT